MPGVDRFDDRERFEFGANWRRFLNGLDEARTAEAGESLGNISSCP